MKAVSVLAIVGLAAVASAQGLNDLPSCASECAIKSLGSTSCKQSDFKCICGAEEFIKSIAECVGAACNKQDYQKTLDFSKKLCAGVGVNLPEDVVSAASGSPSGSAAASASASATATSSASEPDESGDADASPTGSAASASSSSAGTINRASSMGLGAAIAAFFL